ncbi:MAG: hypothetical protein AVDCRST_MAG88-4353, partial [uncultured Thermomicrobiales bacterium]
GASRGVAANPAARGGGPGRAGRLRLPPVGAGLAGPAGRGGAPLARPAGGEPGAPDHRPPAPLGGARLLVDPRRAVLRHPALRPAVHRRGGVAPGGRRLGPATTHPLARGSPCPPAPGDRRHARVLRQSRPPVLHRRRRQRHLGGHPARPDPGRGGCAGRGHRG